MKKLILTTAVLVMSVMGSSTFAQSSNNDEGVIVVGKDAKWDNWYIGAGIGGSVFAGEADHLGPFGGRLAPAFNVTLGKWITPYVGFRIQYNGPQSRGYIGDKNGDFVYGDINSDGLYKEKWGYAHLNFDAMLDVFNYFGGYKEDRFYSLVPYAGIGWMHNTDTANDAITANLGLHNSFRLNSSFDLNVDVRGTIIGEGTIDNTVGGRINSDGMITATVGVTYNFNRKGWKKPIPSSVINEYKSTISSKQADINKYRAQLEAANKENDNLEKLLAEARANSNTKVDVQVPSSVIVFDINSSNLSKVSKINLEQLAEFAENLPADKKLVIVGYADKKTGSEKFNAKLSQDRADAVYNFLTEECGVSSSKLSVSSRGGVDNMFHDDASLSRVVIID